MPPAQELPSEMPFSTSGTWERTADGGWRQIFDQVNESNGAYTRVETYYRDGSGKLVQVQVGSNVLTHPVFKKNTFAPGGIFSTKPTVSDTRVASNLLYRVGLLTHTDACDLVHWSLQGPEGERDTHLHVYIRCSDVFRWTTCDMVEVTAANFDLLETTFTELETLVFDYEYQSDLDFADVVPFALHLFCARERGMRPQGAYYEDLYLSGFATLSRIIQEMFDKCGPARPIDKQNPRDREQYRIPEEE